MRFYIKLSYWLLLWSGILSPEYLFSQRPNEILQLKTVVIDPGHGGSDPGAVSGGVKEKSIVLDIALILGNKIKKAFPEVKVLYTRSKDVFIPLYSRAAFANRNKADLFLSLHANCVPGSSARGTETYTLGLYRSQENLDVAKKENSVILLEDDYTTNYEGFNPNETESYIMFENMQSEFQTQSIDLAASIQEEFTKTIKLTNRGVKQAGFLVLRQTTMPCALIEIGFISNPVERKLLISELGKEKIAESLFKAFSNFKKSVDNKSQFNITPLTGNTPLDQTSDTAYQVKEIAQNPKADLSPDKQKAEQQSNDVQSDKRIEKDGEIISSGKNLINSDKKDSVVTARPPEDMKTGAKKETANYSPPTLKNSVRKDPGAPMGTANSIWYSVQVGASTKYIEPSGKYFKGEKGIIQLKTTPYYKYYSGRFSTTKGAYTEWSRLVKKFPDAFVVIVENGISRPLKNSDIR